MMGENMIDMMDALKTRISGLTLKNPFMNASGILGETEAGLSTVLSNGPGAVVTKSTGSVEKKGNSMPVFVELEHGLLNAFGLPNPGIGSMIEECTVIKREVKESGTALVLSVFGSDPEEFSLLAAQAADSRIFDVLELNLSCPHAKGYGMQLGTDEDMVREVVSASKKSFGGPVWVKLTPNVTDIKSIGRAASIGGADAIVAVNTLKAIAIDADTMKPLLGNVIGGYSGPGIKPVALRAVWDLYEELGDRTPVIGVGGISSGMDAMEFILAGASAVQIGSAFYYRGDNALRLIMDEFVKLVLQKDMTVRELIGRAH